MSVRHNLLVWLLSTGFYTSALAGPEWLQVAPAGYRSALTTPVPDVLPTGQVALGLANELPVTGTDRDGYSLGLGLGLWDQFELFGVVASHELNSNCFVSNCGLRDLSVSAKLALPELDQLFQVAPSVWWPRVAIGGTDLAGAARHNQAAYAVLGWVLSDWVANVGWGVVRDEPIRSPLKGPFASVLWKRNAPLRPVVEYVDGQVQAGGQLWLSRRDWPVSLSTSVYVRPQDELNRWGLTLGISRPLDFSKPSHTVQTAVVSQSVMPAGQPSQSQSGVQSPRLVSSGSWSAEALIARLHQAGFQDVQVQSGPRYMVVVDGQGFDWNLLDALGAALAQIHHGSADLQTALPFTLVVQKYQQPLLAVDSDTGCLRQWADSRQGTCVGPVLSNIRTDFAGSMAGDQTPYRQRLSQTRLELAPKLDYALATEVGVLDYSLGADVNLKVPLGWPGALLEANAILPIQDSEDYQAGGVYAGNALRQGLDKALLHQFWSPQPPLRTHVMAGRLSADQQGILAEAQWALPASSQQLRLSAGAYREDGLAETVLPVWAGYRMNWHNLVLGLDAGQFYAGDQGVRLSSQWWYGDTAIELQYARINSPEQTSFVGLQVSLPLTWRQNLQRGGVHLGGNPSYHQDIRTRVNHRSNTLVSGLAEDFSRAYTLDDLRNRNRLSVDYVQQHLDRVRAAFLAH